MGAVQGAVSHDSVDAGSPIKIGGKAVNNTDPTAVAGADRVNAWFDVNGALVTDPRPATWVESASSISSAANSVSHASTSGQTHYITNITVTYRTPNSAVNRQVDVYDGSAVKFTFYIGEFGLNFQRPLKMTQGNKIVVETEAGGTTGACYVNLFGYTKDD